MNWRKGGTGPLGQPAQPAQSSWQDPVFRLGALSGLGAFAGGALPWWAQAPGGSGGGSGEPAPGPASPTYGTTPESHRSPGYMGPGSVGGDPFGSRPAYHLNTTQAGYLANALGGLTGIPGLEQAAEMYGHATGADNPFPANPPPGVTVTDMDPNGPTNNPVRYEGYGSDPYGGGFGHVYYGPARGLTDAERGENAMNEFGASQLDYWNTRHPGQGIGGPGMGGYGTGWNGGAGGAGAAFTGTASPWDWGTPGNALR